MTLPVHVGIDASYNNDSTGVVIAQRQPFPGESPDHRIVLRSKVWGNPEKPGTRAYEVYQVPILEVEDYLRTLFLRFQEPAAVDDRGRPLRGPAFYYDPMYFFRSASQLESEGLNMIKLPQGPGRMVPVSLAFYEAILKGIVAHDGNATLAEHVANVIRRDTPNGWVMDKPARGGKRKTDLAMAAAFAVWGATQFRPAPKVSKYETRGLRTIQDDDERDEAESTADELETVATR